MEIEHDDAGLARIESEADFSDGRSGDIVAQLRRRFQFIRAAKSERDLYAFKSLRIEKLKGKRRGQHSMRVNDQWRLIFEIRGKHPHKRIGIIEFVGRNHDVTNSNLGSQRLGLLEFPGCQARTDRCDSDGPLAESKLRGLGHDRAIDAGRKRNRTLADRRDRLEQLFTFGGQV